MPFALLVLLMSFYNRIDPVLIERLLPAPLGEEQSGVYAQAFRLLDAGQKFLLFCLLFCYYQYFLKCLAKRIHRKNGKAFILNNYFWGINYSYNFTSFSPMI